MRELLLLSSVGALLLHVGFRDLLQITKRLASIFGIVDVCDFPAPVDLRMALARGSDVYFKLVIPDGCNELLNSVSYPACARSSLLPCLQIIMSFSEHLSKSSAGLAGSKLM
jgi:hypothetical protein